MNIGVSAITPVLPATPIPAPKQAEPADCTMETTDEPDDEYVNLVPFKASSPTLGSPTSEAIYEDMDMRATGLTS